jgi:hypothetical protein
MENQKEMTPYAPPAIVEFGPVELVTHDNPLRGVRGSYKKDMLEADNSTKQY